MHLMPKQGDREPWLNPQNYKKDKKMIRSAPIEDGALIFSNSSETSFALNDNGEPLVAAE